MIFDAFDSIRIINLAARKDRRAEMLGELRRVGLQNDPRVSFFDAVVASDKGLFLSSGERGCFKSHLAVLKEAAEKEHSVLILEDDVDFTRDATNRELHGPLSIFYGGYDASEPDNVATSDIIGAHCMGFSASVAVRLSRYLSDIAKVPDIKSGERRHPPIDGAYVWFRRAYPDVPTEFADPQIARQRPSRTNIGELRWFDRAPGWREAASIARKAKRLLS